MTKLSVNINKIATLRNARGGNEPDVIRAAVSIQEYGADGITVHPRPDERHIRYRDVYALKEVVTTEFNIEGFPDVAFLKLIADVRPDQVTLVPDPPHVLTSNAGWDTVSRMEFLKDTVAGLKQLGCRVSLFVDPVPAMVTAAAETGADRVELYTETYAAAYPGGPEAAIAPFVEAAGAASRVGLGLNAGHDLSLANLAFFHKHIPGLLEVSIGHALISDSLYYGLKETIRLYRACLQP